MEIYENENDQVEAIKRFFAENGKALTVGIVLGVGALIGWRFWSNHQVESSRSLSLAYDNVMASVEAEKLETLASMSEFAAENKNIYGTFASLNLAKQYADKNDLNKVAQSLSQAITTAKDDNIKAVIALRLARVQIEQKQADEALKTLASVKGDAWAMLVANLRGEALLSKGDKQGAIDTWRKGTALKASPSLSEMLQMKINNLSV